MIADEKSWPTDITWGDECCQIRWPTPRQTVSSITTGGSCQRLAVLGTSWDIQLTCGEVKLLSLDQIYADQRRSVTDPGARVLVDGYVNAVLGPRRSGSGGRV